SSTPAAGSRDPEVGEVAPRNLDPRDGSRQAVPEVDNTEVDAGAADIDALERNIVRGVWRLALPMLERAVANVQAEPHVLRDRGAELLESPAVALHPVGRHPS